MRNKIRVGMLLAVAITYMSSCYYDKANELYPAKACKADNGYAVSFSNDILPIFAANCATSGCHTGNVPEGNINLDPDQAYAQLMRSGSGYIDTADPQASLLYAQLLSATEPMPPNYRLDDCSLKLILQWIQQNAPNN